VRPSHLYLLLKSRHRWQERYQRSIHLRLLGGWNVFLAIVGVLLAVALFIIGLAYAGLTYDLPSHQTLPVLLNNQNGMLLQPTRLYDRSGQVLLLSLENPGIPRRYLSVYPGLPEAFAPQLLLVTVASQETGFWKASGMSFSSLTRPEPVTIAEKLVDSLLLEGEPQGLRRSLRMRILAVQLISQYGHAQVLEWYLNSAYYGHLAYGADSAAWLYLGKPASQLNLAESALITAVLDAPALNPLDVPGAALERQKSLLDSLYASSIIGQNDYQQALQTSLNLRTAQPEPLESARAFTRLVLNQLAVRYSQSRLERGGLKIITSLDYSLQLELVCTVRTQLLRVAGQAGDVNLPDGQPCSAARLLPTLPPDEALPADTLGAALVLDLKSGQVLALLGEGTLSGETGFLSTHQPGSLLTPFLAVAAFTRGLSPASLVWDVPESLPVNLVEYANPQQDYTGPIRLRQALANDDMAALTQVLEQLGANNAWQLVEPLGLSSLTSSSQPDSLLYAGGDVSLLEMAQAYASLANLGVQIGRAEQPGSIPQPIIVLQVEDTSGRIWIANTSPDTRAVLSEAVAYLVHHVLSDEPARWPSLGYPNPLEIGRPAGAKTGITFDRTQAWTAGYTRQYLTMVWMEVPPAEALTNPLSPLPAAGIWHAMMQHLHRGLPVENWIAPPGISTINVCDPSGLLPTSACPRVVSEVFLSGNEPVSYDNLYRLLQVNRETGRLATVFTPLELIEEHTFLLVPPEAQSWAASAGLPIPPRDYDAIQAPVVRPDVNITTPGLFAYVKGMLNVKGTAGGDGFASYRLQAGEGVNPQNWLLVGEGSSPVQANALAAWDTTGLEGLYALRLTVVRGDQRLETAVIQITVDNTPPVIQVNEPFEGQEITLDDNDLAILRASVEDNFALERVEWLVDGKQVGESIRAPFTLAWQAHPGKHTLVLRAYDRAGNMTETQPISFTVQ
jgi:membrane carboxypeptidase/penicillin-binding protein